MDSRLGLGACAFVLFACHLVICHGKYENVEETDKPFNMNKVNLIWQKAKMKLDDSIKLSALYQELKYQDQLEAELKRKRTGGEDNDGEYEALTRTKFLDILAKYGLEGIHPDAGKIDPKRSNEVYEKLELKDRWERVLSDKKLGMLWKTALSSGFSDRELGALRSEFLHHLDKVEELNSLHADMMNKNLRDNSVEGLKKEGSKDSLRAERESHVDVKKRYKELRESIMDLEQRIHSEKTLDKSVAGGFRHPKVIDLWFNARKSNFTEEELISLQEELAHFQHKLEKLEHMEGERDNLGEKVKLKHHQVGDVPELHLKSQEKVKEYTRKLKKHEFELRNRIDKASARNEL